MGQKSIALLGVIIFISTISQATHAVTPGPLAQVQESVDAVISTLQDTRLEREARHKKISALIRARFDFEAMSQRVLATNWKKADEGQRERFIDLFSRLLENSYMDRIDAYNDEEVRYVKEKMKKKKAIVETVIVTKSVEIPIKYRMLQKEGGWYVYDVIIEEVSLVRNYRSSYKEIVKKEGFDGLFNRMEDRLKDMEESRKKEKK